MTIWKKEGSKKPSGGRLRMSQKKRKFELGPDPSPAAVGKEDLRKQVRARGGYNAPKLVTAAFANLVDGKAIKKVKIIHVVENKANRHFTRRNILTKGTVIKTEAGNAVVTSRPTQDAVVNARLIK